MLASVTIAIKTLITDLIYLRTDHVSLLVSCETFHADRNGVAYLCGHLHTLGDLVPNMYTRQKTGMLELELGDWKINRMYVDIML